MTANEKKTFGLDTNVILHDYRSIYNFTNNDIVIPLTSSLKKCSFYN